MSDPLRLVDESTDDMIRSMLTAAREERPQSGSLERVLLGVAAGGAVSSAAATAAAATAKGAAGKAALAGGAAGSAASGSAAIGAAKALSAGVLLKAMATGFVASSVVMVGASRVSDRLAPDPAPRRSSVVVAQPRSVAATEVQRDEPIGAESRDEPTAEEEPPRPATLGRAAGTAQRDRTLSEELALIDRARTALRRGDTASALDALAQHRIRFAAGRLAPEARALRMEAELARGNSRAAASIARRVVDGDPRSPHAARAQQVLRQVEAEQ